MKLTDSTKWHATIKIYRIIIEQEASKTRVMGMEAENRHRLANGDSVAYGDEEFMHEAQYQRSKADELRQIEDEWRDRQD